MMMQGEGGNGAGVMHKMGLEESLSHREGSEEAGEDVAIKILLSNKDAGSLIGRGGGTIVELQALTGCRMRVSKADEFFPGTNDRVVLMTGSYDSVEHGLTLVIEQVHKSFVDYPAGQASPDKGHLGADSSAVKSISMAVPSVACGMLIGRGGENVRGIAQKTGSRVQLAGKESQIQGLPERVLSMTGSADGNSQAASMILDLLSQDASGKYDHMSTNYRAYAHSAFQAPVSILQHQHEQVAAGGYQFGSPQHSPQPLARNLQAMALQGMASQQHAGVLPALAQTPTQMTIQVTNAMVPTILGRGGSVLKEIQGRTGARLRVSQKGEYVEGTTDRTVTIQANSHQAAHNAYMLIAQKIGIAL